VPAPEAPPAVKEEEAPPAVETPSAPVAVFAGDRVDAANGQVVWYYPVNFVDPRVLREELNSWKTPEGKVDVMSGRLSCPPPGQLDSVLPSSNVLRIQEKRENLPLLEKMLEILDQPVPQVLVKAKLVEVTYSGRLEFGIDTSYLAPGRTAFRGASAIFNPESYLNASTARPFQGATTAFAFVGDTQTNYGTFEAAVRMVKSKGKAEILGEPNILATQGQKATINAGEDVPVQEATIVGASIQTQIRYRQTGILLEITPELIGRDAVRLRLKETVSAVTGFVTGQEGVQNPVINQRSAETLLTVRDGATLVVGGLQSKRKIEEQRGIPILMDIPLLGWFFSSNSKDEVRTELYFIATPEIVRGSYGEGLILPPGEQERLAGLPNE
jgi:general secretion pathway protein D